MLNGNICASFEKRILLFQESKGQFRKCSCSLSLSFHRIEGSQHLGQVITWLPSPAQSSIH